jgi:DNA primase catalytic core
MTIIEEIKSRIDLVDFVGEKVTLKKSGSSSYSGFCPFHSNTKTPSFAVFPQTQTWRCFGACNEGGDIFDYVMKLDGIDLGQAIVSLAGRAGIVLDNSPEGVAKQRKQTELRVLHAAVADHYRENLRRNYKAQGFLRGRGFRNGTIFNGLIGYAEGHELVRYLRQRDLLDVAIDNHILGHDNGRSYDPLHDGVVYICHNAHGQIVDFESRSITEKKHRRLGPKQPFWALHTKKGQLVVVEGPADALTWWQMGINALATNGVNLAGLDMADFKRFEVYHVQDRDEAGDVSAVKLASAIGPMTRMVKTWSIAGVKDSNDLIRNGLKPERKHFEAMLRGGTIYIDGLIWLASQATDSEFDVLIGEIFSQLRKLENIPLLRYKKQVCKALKMSSPDFAQYMKVSEPEPTSEAEFEVDFRTAKDFYAVKNNRTFYLKQDKEGAIRPELLIEAELSISKIVHRIGNEEQIELLIDCQQPNGAGGAKKLPAAKIPLQDFESMRWVTNHWPLLGIRPPVKDNAAFLREAIQNLSKPSHKIIFEQTGWRMVDGQRCFLTNEGALGYGGETDIEVDLSVDRAETNMKYYRLPLEPVNIVEAWKASLDLWDGLGDGAILLWAAAHLAPLKPLLSPTFVIMIYARTNSFKSTIATLFQSYFGDWHKHGSKDAWKYLAGSFRSTLHSIIKNSYLAKDTLFVIDDFFPREDTEAKRMVGTLVELIRGFGNSAGRDRLKGGGRFQTHSDKPRCLSIITAEELPKEKLEESDLARIISYPLKSWDKDDPMLEGFLRRLNEAYNVQGPHLPHAMSAFCLYLSENWEELQKQLPTVEAKNLALFNKSRYPRQPESFAKLLTAIDVALLYAVSIGAINEAEAKKRQKRALAVLKDIMESHGLQIQSSDPTERFVEVLRDKLDDNWLLATGQMSGKASSDDTEIKVPYGHEHAGYKDDTFIYLKPEYFKKVLADKYKPFTLGLNTMYERLAQKGWLVRGADGAATQTRWVFHRNSAIRLVHIPLHVVYPELKEEK